LAKFVIFEVMDPIQNPYTPGAGTQPPELAGRDELREKVRISTERLRIGNAAKSVIMVGLRGVGKTVLLDRMRTEALARGACTVRIEAQENKSLPALLAPELRLAMLRLSQVDAAKDMAQRALRALAGFAKSLKLKFNDIEVGFDFDSEPGLADNGELESDLAALLAQAGQAALAAKTVLVMFIDELQYVPSTQLSALIGALHRCAHDKLPVTMVGAGLPQLLGLAGTAKSYAERLFDYPVVGQLQAAAARDALCKPAAKLGVALTDEAVDAIVVQTQGYPYFLQEWGKHVWEVAQQSPITHSDVHAATRLAIATLDESFFKVRLERTTPAERRYLQAMAQLGSDAMRSGDIALKLGKKGSTLGPVRASLISKGMIWSPAHGDTAFTVPLFKDYLLRTLLNQP
jgi:AAA ATPase domain